MRTVSQSEVAEERDARQILFVRDGGAAEDNSDTHAATSERQADEQEPFACALEA